MINAINTEEKKSLGKYLVLLENFINGNMTASQFEKDFLDMHRIDAFFYSEKAGEYLSILYSDIDSFCGDPDIADYTESNPFHDIDENELRERVNLIYEKLKCLIQE